MGFHRPETIRNYPASAAIGIVAMFWVIQRVAAFEADQGC
jgi:hypothetical protein